VTAVDGVDLDVYPGECLGIVGESGSGKSVTFASVIGAVRQPGYVAAGSVIFNGVDIRQLDAKEQRSIRGRDIALTMQDALTALNPALTVGEQIEEVILAHDRELPLQNRRRAARERAIEMLELVGIAAAAKRMRDYPHQFSGGMRQRIMIGIALACRPKLLIADEPTTALDVTIQAQVLDLIAQLRSKFAMSVVLITHDLGVVAENTDRVAVMYAGQLVEIGPTQDVIASPLHPYTRGLIRLMPRLAALDTDIEPIEGQVPELIDLPDRCRFFERCEFHSTKCAIKVPMRRVTEHRSVRCVLPEAPVV